ncbi:MAG TPA: preprotein translocase subunit SecE [Polyangiaceae bacterium]
MATKLEEDEKRDATGEEPEADAVSDVSGMGAIEPVPGEGVPGDERSDATPEADATPVHLGATKYVHAAFIGAAILVAYLSGKVVTLLWNSFAEWPTAVRAVPQLLSYGESERESFGLLAGALIGVITVVQTYRKEHIRRWAGEVAGELSKVTWPNRETVTNGTVVVVIASMIATAYVALLDKFWGFVTNLVYGA